MTIFILFPHQLFENISNLQSSKTIYLLEHPIFFGKRKIQMNFNKKKLILHRATMKYYEDYLRKNISAKIIYKEYEELANYPTGIPPSFKFLKDVSYYKTIDHILEEALKIIPEKIALEPLNFITTDEEFAKYYDTIKSRKKPFFQTGFYKWQRERLDILMKNGKPVGGKLTYDNENRCSLPKKIKIPEITIQHDSKSTPYIKEAITYIEKYFPNNSGNSYEDEFWCPINWNEAKKWLIIFLQKRFHLFGTYQDAITENSNSFLFHSGISCSLNIGILIPQDIIKETLQYAEKNNISINQTEGFIRQILGWREFSRFTYQYIYKEMTTINYFSAKNRMGTSFYNGTTGIQPLDNCIKKAFKNGYLHHIERLMIVGCLCMMSGIYPDDVYKWFMEFAVDSYDWVMINNVYSMALYSDGGLTTSKAYAASSNYEMIRKSDYKKGEWENIWNGLYWNFIGNNLEKMKKMGRFGPIQAKNWMNKTKKEKRKFQELSMNFIKRNIL
jgi:deoxyribodipyrimidine photolyase-related protein